MKNALSTPCAPAEEGAGIGDKHVSALPGRYLLGITYICTFSIESI